MAIKETLAGHLRQIALVPIGREGMKHCALFVLLLAVLIAAALGPACNKRSDSKRVRFEVSFPASLRSEPATGRAYVLITRTRDGRALGQRSFGHQPVSSSTGEPFFAIDVDQVSAGAI